MYSLHDFATEKIARRKQEGLFRKLTTPQASIDFSSNDYLGLSRSEELYKIIQQKASTLNQKCNGATGSRLLSGNSLYAEALEQKLASHFKGESSLLFNSGYAANQAVLSSLPQKNDVILYDELAHACIKDGARLSLATRHPFRHNDLEDLERKIKKTTAAGRIFIAVESIYSMDGDTCPLPQLVTLAEQYGASIVLDEAHSTGVEGHHGSGMATRLSLENKIDIRIHTFGKALGVHGACVVTTTPLVEYLINFARPFIYTTALPPHSLVSIDCAIDYSIQHPSLQSTLIENVNLFVKHADFPGRITSNSAIQTAIFPGNNTVKQAANTLQTKGYDVRPILSPTVPRDTERLRICLHAYNTPSEIQGLAEALKQYHSCS
jgi:8-amino-7-oxononanoate synthase